MRGGSDARPVLPQLSGGATKYILYLYAPAVPYGAPVAPMISLNRAIDLLIMKNHIIAMKPDGHSACEFEEEGRKERKVTEQGSRE